MNNESGELNFVFLEFFVGEWIDIMIFRFVVRGIIIYINNLYSIGYLVISDMFGNSYDFDMNELFMYLGSMFEKEVVLK